MTSNPLPRNHVRRPDLPWRVSAITECGRPVAELNHVISRDQIVAQLRRDGYQRTGLTTCMTCLTTARNHPEWADDPVRALGREYFGNGPDPRFSDELRALAALVEAHRDEFDDYLNGLAETVSLADARRARTRRGA